MTNIHNPDYDDRTSIRWPRRRTTCLRVGATLAPLSGSIRQQVYAAMAGSRHQRGRLDDQRRSLVLDAITLVRDRLVHQRPGHPQIAILDGIHRRLERDLDGEVADAA